MTRALVAAGLVVLTGCTSASTIYAPRFVARGELTLRYDDGVEIYAGKKRLTDAPGFGGLADYTRCVPRALEHAEAAESDGGAAIGTGIAGSIIGVSGLGGLSGLAFLDSDKPLAFSLLGTGVAVGLIGMTLALVSRSMKNSANGHAVDAVNYYNDEVGFYGGSCDFKAPKPRRVVVPAAVPPPVAAPPDVEPEVTSPAEETPEVPSPDAPSPDAPSADAPSPDAPEEPLRSTDSVLDGGS